MTDPCLLGAFELARRLRAREFSALELLDAHLARIERLDGRLNAVVVRCFDAARERARAADAELARGRTWGPLHGVPITVKESFDVAGLPTTWGLEAQRENIATATAPTVQRLLDAGAVLMGKTNVPVALADWQTFNPLYGTTGNPWDPQRVPGGSSGGSAAALAAGLSALELGSDIGSSIRNPAHYCGVWGHKPTWGLVPLQGHALPGDVEPDSTDIGAAGPLARSAHDLTQALDLLAGAPGGWTPLGRLTTGWRDAGVPARRLRVALMADEPRAEVDAAVRGELERLADFLRREGVAVDEQARPVDAETAWRVTVPLLRSALCGHLDDAEFAVAQRRAAEAPGPAHEFPAVHWRSQVMTHRDWLRLDEQRAALRRQWAAFFERYDLLISPIAATTAIRHDQAGFRWERMIDVNGRPQPHTTQLFWAIYSGAFGLPSTAVPLGLAADGLPVGAQLIGAPWSDPVTLRFARWLEEAYRGFVAPPLARGDAAWAA